jgi:Ni/Co efflux regulator RcnB
LDNLLTAEQKKKIWEYELVNMDRRQLLSLHVFEAFDLTDAQKQELEVIKKEFVPEFERELDDYVNRQGLESQLYREIVAEYERQGGNTGNLTGPKIEAIRSKLLKEDPEFKKKHDEMVTQRKLYATRLKTKMFDVLTDEQWDRLQELLDNPPEYIIAFRKRIQEAAERAGTWQPGPDSWKPGDGIPEEYRQQRQERRFPRREN